MPAESFHQALSTPGVTSGASRDENYFDALDALPRQNNSRKEESKKRNGRREQNLRINGTASDDASLNEKRIGGDQMSFYGGQGLVKRKAARRGLRKLSDVSESGETQAMFDEGQIDAEDPSKGIPTDEDAQHMVEDGIIERPCNIPQGEGSLRFRGSAAAKRVLNQLRANDTPLPEVSQEHLVKSLELVDSVDSKSLGKLKFRGKEGSSQSYDMAPESPEIPSKQSASELSCITSPSEGLDDMQASSIKVRDPPSHSSQLELKPDSNDVGSDRIENLHPPTSTETDIRKLEPSNVEDLQSPSRGAEARNRWRRAKTKLAFVHHMAEAQRRSACSDFLEQGGDERTGHEGRGDAGKAGAAEFEGTRMRGQFRTKGRRGMEGMVVRQDKGFINLIQDFYVACLKMPIAHFLVGVFLAPIALGLLFTPVYLFDKGGLSFNGVTMAEASSMTGRAAKAKQNISALMNVFLYALSLSTTFGGAPVAALSPYCLLVANVNTLMGQFLFVFLSGAVFARMSHPSHPIRCSKKAIIRADDFTSSYSEELKEKPMIFAVRLVLTGPPPCELVDAKIRLTFRILIKLPSGSMFCSTQDLELVRPEVSYLRYGILVRHVIDSKSPIYGYTMESLIDGDASFSLTVMGLERASMQPIFHLEDYFVWDGDVAWNADYIDFIHINKKGHRVLDHSKIDHITVTKDTKMAPRKSAQEDKEDDQSSVQGLKAGLFTPSKSKAWRAKSTSFTRGVW